MCLVSSACLFVRERWKKKDVVGVGGPECGSHLRLQVHDLLAHQGNGGAGLLPLHRLQLQRGRRHRLQVLPHPGRGGVGLPDALPRPLTRGLLLVLMGRGTEGKLVFSDSHEICDAFQKLQCEFFWWI